MGAFTISIVNDGSSYRCPESRTLLEGMEALGKKGIPVGCRGGGCGVCKVRVLQGTHTKRVMSREHISAQEEADGYVLACRARPTSDTQLQVVGAMKKSVCRVVDLADTQTISQPSNQ